MPKGMQVCSTVGCPEIVRGGRCTECKRQAERRRGSAHRRGYDHQHQVLFRAKVLTRDPVCACDQPGQHDHGQRCTRESQHADHHPLDRAELVRRHLDPNDPTHGRGLCHPCHSGETARLQPGGWNSPR